MRRVLLALILALALVSTGCWWDDLFGGGNEDQLLEGDFIEFNIFNRNSGTGIGGIHIAVIDTNDGGFYEFTTNLLGHVAPYPTNALVTEAQIITRVARDDICYEDYDQITVAKIRKDAKFGDVAVYNIALQPCGTDG